MGKHRLTAHESAEPAPAAPNGAVPDDLPCRRCGYNLRGLNQAGRCPECGAPIGLSCHGDLLRYHDPKWLTTLARGTTFILLSAAVLVLGLAVGITLQIALGGSPVTMALVKALAGMVTFYGAWLITQPDPSGIGEDKYVTERKVIRLALLVALIALVLEIFWEAGFKTGAWALPLGIAKTVGHAVAIVSEVVCLTYYAKLAERIPAPELARRARVLRWPVGLSRGLVIASALGILIMSRAGTWIGQNSPTPGPGAIALIVTLAVALLAYLVVAFLILKLVYRLGCELRIQARQAHEIRAAAEDQTCA